MPIKLSYFGNSCLLDKNKKIILLNNIKEMAILVFLARQPRRWASRKEIAELLWCNADATKRQASLRQAIKNLRALEARIGSKILHVTRVGLQLIEGSVRTDIEEIHYCLSRPADHFVAKAKRLLAPTFLEGFDKLGARFGAWISVEEQKIRNQFLERAAVRLSNLRDVAHPSHAALSRFMLAVNPDYEWAHQRLIHHYLVCGQLGRAVTQFNEYQEIPLGVFQFPALAETKELLESAIESGECGRIGDMVLGPPPISHSDFLPVINVVSEDNRSSAIGDDLLSEYVDQVCRRREFVVRHYSNVRSSVNDRSERVRLESEDGGQFVLSIKKQTNGNGAYVELSSYSDGRPVFVAPLSVSNRAEYEERAFVIKETVDQMHKEVKIYYGTKGELKITKYNKLNTIYDLIRKFDKNANAEALNIIGGLESAGVSSSLLYSFKASLYLQRNHFIDEDKLSDSDLHHAQEMASKAVDLDPWHALNHRYLAFANCFAGLHDDAKESILIGQSLAPTDPLQAIATAEVFALAGDVEGALKYSDEALKHRDQLPRYAYGYLANVQFAAGKHEEAATLAQRAPFESMDYRATRIAALWEMGKKSEAHSEMQKLMEFMAHQTHGAKGANAERICNWLSELSPYGDSRTKMTFNNGIWRAAGLI